MFVYEGRKIMPRLNLTPQEAKRLLIVSREIADTDKKRFR